MKKEGIILGLAALLFLTGCKKDDDENGFLTVKMSSWNNYMNSSKTTLATKENGDTITLDIVDMKKFRFDLKVTTDEITAGVPDDFDWISIYESNQTLLDSERDFQFELPVGNYRGIGIMQGNQHHWVCNYDGDVIEIPSLNNDELSDEAIIYDIFGENGLFVLDENDLLEAASNNEKLGTFEILPGKNTSVTIRMNLATLDWYDNDGDGQWSEGDDIGNWTLPEGVTTMADFIVEYD
jgi:hypothetical protein